MESSNNDHFQSKNSVPNRKIAPTLLFRICHFSLSSVTYFFLSRNGQTSAQAVRLYGGNCIRMLVFGSNHEDYKWVN